MIHDPGFLAFRETSDRMCESMLSASCYQATTFPQAQVRFHGHKRLHLYSRQFKASKSQMNMGKCVSGSHQDKSLSAAVNLWAMFNRVCGLSIPLLDWEWSF
jgi:hypothetical protein